MVPDERALLDVLRGRRPAGPLDPAVWTGVLALAEREGLSPIVHARLREQAPRYAAPPAVASALARRYREGAQLGARAHAELEDVLRALGARGVRAMLLKGAALAHFSYGDPAMRPFTDLDLLVRPDDLAAAALAMREAGYATAPQDRRTGTYARGYFSPSWTRLPVDIHWRYAESFHGIDLDYGQVFARAAAVPIGRERALLPAAEDLLVALSVHVARETWESRPVLRYLCDAAATIRRRGVDWDRLCARAGDGVHLRAPLRLTLLTAGAVLGVKIPPSAVKAIRPRRGAGIDRIVIGRACRTVLRRPSPLEALARIALLRWADGDPAPLYGALVRDRAAVQGARVRAYLHRRVERTRLLGRYLLTR